MSLTSVPISRMIIACHAIAITCTVARLLYQCCTRRFWWEDFCAVIATAWAIMCLAGFLLYDTSMSPLSTRNQIASWFMTLSFTGVLWSVSYMACGIVSSQRSRSAALAGVASFLIMFVASMAQKIYYCVADRCSIVVAIGIMQLITDIIADSILILGPILLLRDVQLSRNRRILIFSAFSSSILVTAISIAHSVLLLDEPNVVTLILGEMKTAVSLFVCNVLVLVTLAYRICNRSKICGGGGANLDLFGNTSIRETGPFYLTTTIDLDLGIGLGTVTISGCECRSDASAEEVDRSGVVEELSRSSSSSVVPATGYTGADKDATVTLKVERTEDRCERRRGCESGCAS